MLSDSLRHKHYVYGVNDSVFGNNVCLHDLRIIYNGARDSSQIILCN
jgi:hypothetical protein